MMVRNPATILGLQVDTGRIAPGCRAKFVLATDIFQVVGMDGRGIEDS
jgi:alpha-D-ribose 1-methylphosphonate 5-triphosphate diphosphatase PhnM